jgi:cytochrome c5
MSRSFKFSCILTAALAFAACGDSGDDDGAGSTVNPAGGGDAGAGACTADTYALYYKNFFMTTCQPCHSATLDMSKMMNVKLDTQPGILAAKAAIIQHAVQLVPPVMPMAGPLAQTDRDRLKKWLDCGAP